MPTRLTADELDRIDDLWTAGPAPWSRSATDIARNLDVNAGAGSPRWRPG